MNMNKIKTMLSGMVIMILGNYCASIMSSGNNVGNFISFIGLFAPILGLIIFLIGFFKKEKAEEKTKEDKKE